MTRLRTIRIAALAFTLALPAAAMAFTPQEEKILERDCSGDYLRLCGQYDPGSKQVEACFQQRMRELTPACRNSIQQITARGGRR